MPLPDDFLAFLSSESVSYLFPPEWPEGQKLPGRETPQWQIIVKYFKMKIATAELQKRWAFFSLLLHTIGISTKTHEIFTATIGKRRGRNVFARHCRCCDGGGSADPA